MSTEPVVTPGKVGEQGFVDVAAHRAPMAAAYNRYTVVGVDPGYRADLEEHRAVLFPLFFTSFLLDDLLADDADFDHVGRCILFERVEQDVARHRLPGVRERGGVGVVGLTSAADRGFVEGLGVYDRVVLYDDVASLAGTSAVYVDVAGDPALRAQVHRTVRRRPAGEPHRRRVALGADVGRRPRRPARPAARVLLRAEPQIAKRNDDWGPEGLNERVDQAWDRFVTWTQGWLTLDHGAGAAALEATYLDVLGNRERAPVRPHPRARRTDLTHRPRSGSTARGPG